MGTRRPRGENAFYYSDAHNRYEATLNLPNGKKKTIASSTKGTKSQKYKECIKKLEEAKKLAEAGLDLQSGEQRVSDYLNEWTKSYELLVRNSTYDKQEYRINDILAAFGGFKLKELRPEHIQLWINEKAAKLAPATIKKAYGLLKQAFRQAVERGYIVITPCRGITLPRDEEEEMIILDSPQRASFLEHLNKEKYETLFTVTLMCAMRSGEVRGLCWEAINFESGTVSVRGTIVYLAKEGYEQHKPKTKAGKRDIPLPDETLAKLRLHRAAQKEQYLKAGMAWNEQELVFQGQALGKPMNDSSMRYALSVILKACGLPMIRVHDLRHTGITWWLLSGVKPKTVMRWAGHTRIEMTFRYVHSMPETIEEDRQLFNEAVKRAVS